MNFFDIQVVDNTTFKHHLKAAAALRAQTLQDYPYFHTTSPEIEEKKLMEMKGHTTFIMAFEQTSKELAGIAMLKALKDADPAYTKALKNHYDLEKMYLIEHILITHKWRSKGIGKAMYQIAENYLYLSKSAQTVVLNHVERPKINPLSEPLYFFKDTYMHEKGFKNRSDIHLEIAWADTGEAKETKKTHTLWIKKMPNKQMIQSSQTIKAPFKKRSQLI